MKYYCTDCRQKSNIYIKRFNTPECIHCGSSNIKEIPSMPKPKKENEEEEDEDPIAIN